MQQRFTSPAIDSLERFVFGKAPHPVRAGRGVVFGNGIVIPEINFTLPPIEITELNWKSICQEYSEMIEAVCRRAVELETPALLVEFETLPPMTDRPDWGLEITCIIAGTLDRYFEQHGLKSALRFTPNDNRCHERPPLMRNGNYWENMMRIFDGAADAGGDLISIESTGGKEISDDALMNADLPGLVFALGVLGARDMEFLWDHIVSVCDRDRIVAAGDTACAFANTAMVLAEQKMIPRVLAAVARVASVPRSLIAFERGAIGPSKDCAYEGPYLKAITGAPISMEGRTAACAHLSPVGNIAQAVCDCWSNESTSNVRLLSAPAPVVSLEQLVYDCRLLNVASRNAGDAQRLRDLLTQSDAPLDPQAHVLRPDVVLRIAPKLLEQQTCYDRTRLAVLLTLEELRHGHTCGSVRIPPRELRWLDSLQKQADGLPESEQQFIAEFLPTVSSETLLAQEYGL